MHRFAAFPPPPALCAFGDATLAYQSVTLFAKSIDRCMHTNQQLFRRPCWDACPLERLNLLALVLDLAPHALDFCADRPKFHERTLVPHKNITRTYPQAASNGVPSAKHPNVRNACATSRRKGEINVL
jgi:hypothetical protein